MGTTTNYGLRYPVLADPPNIPLYIKNLADDTEGELNRLGLIARNARSTNISTDGTLARVISTSANVRNGRSYLVSCHCEILSNSAPVTSQAELRYSTTAEPTTSSTLLNRAVTRHMVQDVPDTVVVSGVYVATASATLRVALCVYRPVGSGPLAIGGSSGFPCEITIQDVGVTRATTGTIYS